MPALLIVAARSVDTTRDDVIQHLYCAPNAVTARTSLGHFLAMIPGHRLVWWTVLISLATGCTTGRFPLVWKQATHADEVVPVAQQASPASLPPPPSRLPPTAPGFGRQSESFAFPNRGFPVVPVSGLQDELLPEPELDTSPPNQVRLPVVTPAADNVQLTQQNDLISLTANDAALSAVLGIIAEQHELNVVTGDAVTERITVKLSDVQLNDALDTILLANGYTWTQRKNILIVSKISREQATSPAIQGREVRTFTLNYVMATDVDKVVQGLLSPVGQSFTNQIMPTDHRRTQEQVVVEDLPSYLQRIEQYIASVDIAPRQVMVEAHVLQVQLKDNCRHGVDIENLLRVANSNVTLQAADFVTGASPAALLRIDGHDLDLAIEAIKSTTDAKTLASPKVTVLNGQEARIQVGGRIGYLLTTTTQTSTLQSVDFLDIGIILRVTPTITDDNQILMQVNPEVSTGRINSTTQLPESETTEVETRVLLADGEALLIGGLIKEADSDSQNKIPFLGDLWVIGRLFQRREIVRERNEYILTLLPRIVPDAPGCRAVIPEAIEAAGTPLLDYNLQSVDRTRWEAQLPDAGRPQRRADVLPPGTVHAPPYGPVEGPYLVLPPDYPGAVHAAEPQ